MKLPSKYIALLVVLSLAGIFAYQAYWLTGLYRTMRTDLERNITEAMRISDYNEMLVRIELMQRRKTFRLRLEEVRLADLLPSLVELHKLKADKPVHVTLDIVPENLTVTADRTHLANIVSNLLDNAVKYSRDRADITVRCRRTETDGRTWAEINVADHGIGIARDRQPHVFDKFYRVPTGNLHEVKGYGLGLFYVKTMVEKHGGTVEVKSEPDKGSEFIVRI